MSTYEKNFTRESLGENYNSVAEKLFVYCIAWSIGACLEEDGRKKLSGCLTDIDSCFPAAGTIYDYLVDISKNEFLSWDTKVINHNPKP